MKNTFIKLLKISVYKKKNTKDESIIKWLDPS